MRKIQYEFTRGKREIFHSPVVFPFIPVLFAPRAAAEASDRGKFRIHCHRKKRALPVRSVGYMSRDRRRWIPRARLYRRRIIYTRDRS